VSEYFTTGGPTRYYATIWDRARQKMRYRANITEVGAELVVRGWNAGVEIHTYPDLDNPGRDKFVIIANRGSNGDDTDRRIIATVTELDNDILVSYPDQAQEPENL
jgi:hypothetical protein